MAQVYERVYGRLANQRASGSGYGSGSGFGPNASGSELTIVTDGNYYLLQVPFFQFGFLTKLLVQQSAGTNVGFTVDVLNSSCGLTPGEITPTQLNTQNGWQQYRIVNPLSATAGSQAQGFTPAGNPYRNLDGADKTRSGVSQAGVGSGFTNASRYIYVLIKPSSGTGGNSKWEVAVNGFTETDG